MLRLAQCKTAFAEKIRQTWALDVPHQDHGDHETRFHTAAGGECTGKGEKPQPSKAVSARHD